MNHKAEQKKYRQAIEVLEKVLETKLDQVKMEPKQKRWKKHEWYLRRAIEMIEDDIPFLDPNY